MRRATVNIKAVGTRTPFQYKNSGKTAYLYHNYSEYFDFLIAGERTISIAI